MSKQIAEPPPGYLSLLEGFVNITLRSTGEVAGDATQTQSANEKNQIDRIRHHYPLHNPVDTGVHISGDRKKRY